MRGEESGHQPELVSPDPFTFRVRCGCGYRSNIYLTRGEAMKAFAGHVRRKVHGRSAQAAHRTNVTPRRYV